MKNIIILCGGRSVEHDVSLTSATAIINSIDREKFNVYGVYIDREGFWNNLNKIDKKIEDKKELILENKWDNRAESLAEFAEFVSELKEPIIFPALHGPNGEDGTVQGFLEVLNLPYIGCGVRTSALAMDKVITREILEQKGISQTEYFYFTHTDWNENKSEIIVKAENLIYPLYIKPANLGSSVGISKVKTEEEFIKAVEYALKYDFKIIVEKEVIGREMQISVIGNEHPKASLPGEFILEDAFFDYDAKYIDGKLIPVVPAKLDEKTTEKIRKLAIEVYKALDSTGLTRIDIFVDEDNNLLVNEANTMPGFTNFSMTPVLWEATEGITYSELVEFLIELALERFEKKEKLIHRR